MRDITALGCSGLLILVVGLLAGCPSCNIYVPTEGGLPLLEASWLARTPAPVAP